MKIQKTELAQKLNKIKGVVPKRTTITALQGILVQNGYLIANNMEMTVKAKIEGADGESFIIPEKAFDLINNLPDGEVEITLSAKDTITIKADKIKNKYQTKNVAEFPLAEMQVESENVTIKSEVLLESIRRVSYAVPSQSSNSVMASMCLQASGGQLNFVGLDGHVLAWDKVDFDGEFELLIPKNTIEKIKTMGLTGDVQIMHSKAAAIFVTDDFEIYTRLTDGEYFKYKTMFKEQSLHTVVSRTEFLDAMTRAKMCTDEKSPAHFIFDSSTLSLNIKDNITDYHEEIELQEPISSQLEIGFNAKLVLETLKAFDCENVGLSLEGPKMPMIVEAEDSDFRTMVLPVAIK